MDGHLGVSSLGLIMNKAGMNLFLYNHSFLLGMYPRVHPLGYTVDSCSTSTDLLKYFPKWLYQFILLSAMFKASSFSLFSGIILFKGPQNKNLTYPVSLYKYFHIINCEINYCIGGIYKLVVLIVYTVCV